MFKSFKAKMLGLISLGAVMATSASAETQPIISQAQQDALLSSMSSAYSQLMAILIAIVGVSAAFYLIASAVRKIGRGQI